MSPIYINQLPLLYLLPPFNPWEIMFKNKGFYCCDYFFLRMNCHTNNIIYMFIKKSLFLCLWVHHTPKAAPTNTILLFSKNLAVFLQSSKHLYPCTCFNLKLPLGIILSFALFYAQYYIKI